MESKNNINKQKQRNPEVLWEGGLKKTRVPFLSTDLSVVYHLGKANKPNWGL